MTADSSLPAPIPKPLPAERIQPKHREQAVETLMQHFASDRLSMDEFEQRTAAVYAARTMIDMRAALVDLPEIPVGTLVDGSTQWGTASGTASS